MYLKAACFMALILLPAAALGKDPPEARADNEKVMSGMSIVGNDEAPKSLVIVPWKSSELGNTLDVSRGLDDGRQDMGLRAHGVGSVFMI